MRGGVGRGATPVLPMSTSGALWSQLGYRGRSGWESRARLCLLVAMQGLAVLLFPAVLMLFALGMEKVQSWTDRVTVNRDNVEEFLSAAESEDVDTLAREGMPAALDELRNRRAG